jgi:soluble lytic murein transglycosylase
LEREHLRRLLASAPTSLLRDAALARLGRSFFESGDYGSTVRTIQPVSDAKTPAGRDALALIGQAYLLSGQQQQAREALTALVTQLPDPARPDDYALAGARGLDALDAGSADAARQKAPQLAEAEHLRRALVYNFNRDFAGARLHYQAIAERYAQSASVADALYQIGRGFYQAADYEQAVGYFKRVLEQYPQSQSARDALSFTAGAFNRMKRADEAVAAYKQFIERFPDAPNPERPYLNIIDALREAGRDREALDWVRQTRARLKGLGANLALFSQAKIHLSQENWAAALADLDALKGETDLGGTRIAGGATQTEVLFLRAYTLEQSGRAGEAVDAYLAIPDGRNEYYGGRATRRLRTLAQDGRFGGVISSRLSQLRDQARQAISGGQAEAARKAAQSALRLTEDAGARGELLDIVKKAYASLPAYQNFPTARLLPAGRQEPFAQARADDSAEPAHGRLADELLFLGLADEGAPELAAAEGAGTNSPGSESKGQQGGAGVDKGAPAQTQATPPPPKAAAPPKATAPSSNSPRDAAYTLAFYFMRGEHADRAVRFAEPLWKNVPADYLLELAPREMAELLYPAPYRDALLEAAPRRGVDPRFILSIARQESRYQPDVKSAAAARGLLQFISSTAERIAGELGLRAFRQDDLYDPRVAVLFGAQYMGNLFKQFPDMPQAVAASYNGGEDNVARWVARSRSKDPDRYVSEIGFAQSKDYVFKVMTNFWAYQTLYDDGLQPK